MAPSGLVTSVGKFIARLAGKAFGYGLRSDVRGACVSNAPALLILSSEPTVAQLLIDRFGGI
jgi:hypothetical protein